MEEFKGTKGEWILEQHTPRVWKITSKNRVEELARVFSDGRLKKHGGLINSETEANAKLIAAAPDLLKALQIAVKKQGYFSDNELIQARKAINKALGK